MTSVLSCGAACLKTCDLAQGSASTAVPSYYRHGCQRQGSHGVAGILRVQQRLQLAKMGFGESVICLGLTSDLGGHIVREEVKWPTRGVSEDQMLAGLLEKI